MRAQVTEEGVNIPKQMLRGAPAVEIRNRDGLILVSPLRDGGSPDEPDLPARQRRLARRHPGEYVVLVDEKIVHHSTERREVLRAYRAACAVSAVRPVIVSPDAVPRRPPILRGRSLKRARPV